MEQQKDGKNRSSGSGWSKSGRRHRDSDRQKLDIVTRLLQGEPIDIRSREKGLEGTALLDSRDKSVAPPIPTATVAAGRVEDKVMSAHGKAQDETASESPSGILNKIEVSPVVEYRDETVGKVPPREETQDRMKHGGQLDGDKEIKADALIKSHMILAAGAGIIPFPVVDLLATIAIQLKLLSRLSTLYEVPFRRKLGRSIIGALVGGTSSSAIAVGTSSLLKSIPIVGYTAGACAVSIYAAASTYAVGHVFARHFRAGGTLLDFDGEKSKARYTELCQNKMEHLKGESSV